MKRIKIYFGLFLMATFLFGKTAAQDKVTVSGYIQDKNSTEKLTGASVIIEGTNKGTASNRYGFYSLTIAPGKYNFRYSFVGYEAQVIELDIKKDMVKNVSLVTDLTLGEVTVKAHSGNSGILKSTETGTNVVSIESIKKTPVIGGENDVLKTLQFLPGVKQSQEGTSGINVRGGSPDQNQILLDGAPVYNAS
ncbi:MAG: TonB-dependent receptor, partial [Bacteroidales bacterium]